MSPCCRLDLEDSIQIFCMTLRLMLIHHHTKVGSKMILSGQTFNDILNLRCYLNLESNYPLFSQKTLWLMTMYHQTTFDSQIQQFRRYSRKDRILTI